MDVIQMGLSWNYDAKIIPRTEIRKVLLDTIVEKAKKFICFISPYWFWGAEKQLDLGERFQQKQDQNVAIYLFGRELPEDQSHNHKMFKYFFFIKNIRNCWFVKNLHTKLYYNEEFILITSANIAPTSLGLRSQSGNVNFEEAVLLKTKKIEINSQTRFFYYNPNPFHIPPLFYLEQDEGYSNKRYLLGSGVEKDKDLEVPAIFSLPEMLKDWLVSTTTIKTYDRDNRSNALLHLGELDSFCPICHSPDYHYARTYICHKHGIEYPKLVDHCTNPFDCEMGPFYKYSQFYEQKCPVTVFYCENEDIFYDPAEDKKIPRGILCSAKDGREIESQEYGEKKHEFLYYCGICGSLLTEREKPMRIYGDSERRVDIDEEIACYNCTGCGRSFIEYCPICDEAFPSIDLNKADFYCDTTGESLDIE